MVLGSLSMDLTTYAQRLPALGETIFGTSFRLSAGGKGANQAVAAAKLGSPTQFYGRVGNDSFGEQAIAALRDAGVDADGVLVDPGQDTGLAVISVDEQADNAITVISGANMALDQSDVKGAEPALSTAGVLLLQLEIPLEASASAAQLARNGGAKVILDPAPAKPLEDDFLSLIDILTPNEVEAADFVGHPIENLDQAARAATSLLERGLDAVVIKLGSRGALMATSRRQVHVPAFSVEAVDTVAAGDAFNGGLATALVEGRPLEEAVRWGSAAGAIAVTRPGAVPAMPERSELEALLMGQA